MTRAAGPCERTFATSCRNAARLCFSRSELRSKPFSPRAQAVPRIQKPTHAVPHPSDARHRPLDRIIGEKPSKKSSSKFGISVARATRSTAALEQATLRPLCTHGRDERGERATHLAATAGCHVRVGSTRAPASGSTGAHSVLTARRMVWLTVRSPAASPSWSNGPKNRVLLPTMNPACSWYSLASPSTPTPNPRALHVRTRQTHTRQRQRAS